MKGMFKKIIGATLALVLAFIGFVSMSSDAYAASANEAYIVVANGDWSLSYFNEGSDDAAIVAVNADVTGYGEYTVSLDFSATTAGSLSNIGFLGVNIEGGETSYPDSFMRITSVKFNDAVSSVSIGEHYTNEENEVRALTRTNLYNAWASPNESVRTKNGSSAVSATPVDVSELTDIYYIEVTFTLQAGVAYNAEPVAYLQYASGDWSSSYWYDGKDYTPVVATNATIDPETSMNSQFTVSLDFTGTTNGMVQGVSFFDVEILNGEYYFPYNFMEIDEVAINGTPITLDFDTYTSSDNESETRTNLYNSWVSGFISVGRTIDATHENISAIPVGSRHFVDVETISVTFTLREGMDIGSTPLPEGGTTGYLLYQNDAGDISFWGETTTITHTDAVITGFGQYTASLDFSTVAGGSIADIAFLDLEVVGGELYFPYNSIVIDELKVNDVAVEIGETYTVPSGDDSRVNLYNVWSAVDESVRLADGADAETASFTPLDVAALTYPVTSISVTFTIVRGQLPEPEEPYELPENFKAFMMFSSEEGGWQRYEAALDLAGDVLITGDGTYTVYIDSTFGGGNNGSAVTGTAVTPQVFLIDIIGFGDAMEFVGTMEEGVVVAEDFSVTVQVWIDGTEITANNGRILKGDLESNGRLRLEFYNIFGTGTETAPVVDPALLVPSQEVRVTFTLSGTGIDLATGYSVSFDSDGGSAVATQNVEDGGVATEPTNPTREGYTFVEWQLDGSAYDFSTTVSADIELVAVWEANAVDTFTVSFDSDGGSAVTSQTVNDGAVATEPTDPTKEGFTFVEWQLDGSAYDFSTAVSADIELVAVWEASGDTGCNTGCNSELALGQVAAMVGVMFSLLGGIAFVFLKKKF